MLHQLNGIINLLQVHVVSHKLIKQHLLVQVGFDHLRNAILALEA